MRIRTNGTELYVDVAGPQRAVHDGRWLERPTVVVLHGGPGFDQGYLRPGLEPLSSDAQVLFVDLRGQGRSGRPPVRTCTLEQMADDVAALCEALGIRRPVVFGHSAGGFVALHLAVRHSDVAGGLVLCNTAATLASAPDDAPPPSLADRAPVEAVAAAARLFGGDFSPGAVSNFARSVAPYYAGPAHMDVPGRLLGLSEFAAEVAGFFFGVLAAGYDLRGRLAEIAVPALVIAGHHDWICPPVAGRTMAGLIPDATYVEVLDAGHFPFSEEPEEFLSVVRPFLADVAVSGARTLPV